MPVPQGLPTEPAEAEWKSANLGRRRHDLGQDIDAPGKNHDCIVRTAAAGIALLTPHAGRTCSIQTREPASACPFHTGSSRQCGNNPGRSYN